MTEASKSAERSSIEIKDLLRKLHPERGNHKDRIRRLNKFRNYVMSNNQGRTPEFFDDDIPLLYLGAATPSVFLDDDDDLPMGLFYGLLFACGMPSDSGDGLKRSARHATNLVKWLLLDWKEGKNNTPSGSEFNVFSKAFLALPVTYYSHMRLDLHVTGDERGGTREDACRIIVLILMKHLTEDGERPQYVIVEELLSTPQAQQAYDLWSARNITVQQQEIIKKNALARQAEIANRQKQDAALAKASGILPGTGIGGNEGDYDGLLDDSDNNNDNDDDNNNNKKDDGDGNANKSADDDKDDDSYYDPDENDVMMAIRRRQKKARRDAEGKDGKKGKSGSNQLLSIATRWEDSQVAREQAARAAAHALSQQRGTGTNQAASANANATANPQSRAQQHDTVRDSQDAAAEAAEREEEKAKLLGRDPLGILSFEDYDLRKIESRQAEQIEQALQDINEEIQKAESTGNEEIIRKAVLQKESLEALVERLGGLDNLEQAVVAAVGANKDPNATNTSTNTVQQSQQRASILPTNPKFDPILFLTLLHRKTPYTTLIQSLDRLSRKTENQAEQLQNLVRDNFPLFVRCAEGFEEFRRSSEQEVGLGVNERIEKLEAIAESSAYQAKKSFKPLLDNTSEVRKVQSALAVLNRVGPILQVPALMRQHIENRRYSQALKTYRRALVIDDSCNIELLKLVKRQAEECVRDARTDLERRFTQDPANASIEDLLNSIRDLGELLELEVSIPPSSTAAVNTSSSASTDGKAQAQSPNKKDKKGATPQLPEPAKDAATILLEQQKAGIYDIGGTVVRIRDHPPALACLLLQAAHFTSGTNRLIVNAEETSQRIYAGESLTQVQNSLDNTTAINGSPGNKGTSTGPQSATTTPGLDKNKAATGIGNQWKYDVLDARVVSTTRAVDMARIWLPRLVRIGKAAREDEKRRAARIGPRRRAAMLRNQNANLDGTNATGAAASVVTAFEVFVNVIAPALTKLVEHAAFCALGSNTRTGAKYVEMTYGQNADEKLRNLLRSPLPPSQSTKVGKELADLVQLLSDSATATDDLRPNNSLYKSSPLEACQRLGDSAVITIEKRRCIYAFDVCSRSCSNRASGSGKFDAEALLSCLKNLSEQLSRPEECSNEVEKGCELVVRRCCEGLAGYVRDRGDDARLSAVAECSDVMSDRIDDVVREVACLTKNSQQVHDVILDDIMGLESAMFDEYLESIRQHVANSVRVGWLDNEFTAGATTAALDNENNTGGESNQPPSFPAYLSASLLAIARCRAQVEQALGSRIRRTALPPPVNTKDTSNNKSQSKSQNSNNNNGSTPGGVSYQHLAMATVADGVIEGICNEVMKRKLKLKVRQADRLANELEFLGNTLRKFITSDETRALLKSTLQMVCTKAGRSSLTSGAGGGGRGGPSGSDYQDFHNQNDGPDGLAALEELERLGRVYVLCLGD